jgi:hypothetical protein
VNGLQGALQTHRSAQFPQGEVRLPAQQRAHLALVLGDDHGLAPGPVMTRGNIPRVPALLDEFLDHAQGNPKASCDILAGCLLSIIGGQYSLSQIQGYGSSVTHHPMLPQPQSHGYTIC